jgi:UDP-N-acetylglucosamine--N-acetylmuramyl-(pentapeptide) pyrophosphoryl-undecaprenol N-acetylglucosamine transferase
MSMTRKKVMITGGHLSPAVALIDEIARRKLPWDIVFVGRRFAVEGSKAKSTEEAVVVSKGVRFIAITTGRLQRSFSRYTLTSLIKIPVGFIQASRIISREKPDVIVSFGGYVALPLVIVSWRLKIPILTHEQTRIPGLANRIIAVFAHTICISFPDMKHAFPKQKTVRTGLPIRKEIFIKSRISPLSLPRSKYPLLYITGGTLGSVSMNTLLFPMIPELLRRYTIIHQTGDASLTQAIQVKMLLNQRLQGRYIIQDYFDAKTTGWIMQAASLIICRSGANTVSELAMLRKKAVCIPLPWSGGGEQMENARWLAVLGLAYVIPQRLVNRDRLLEGIRTLRASVSTAGEESPAILRGGAAKVVDEIAKLLL